MLSIEGCKNTQKQQLPCRKTKETGDDLIEIVEDEFEKKVAIDMVDQIKIIMDGKKVTPFKPSPEEKTYRIPIREWEESLVTIVVEKLNKEVDYTAVLEDSFMKITRK